jgi:hypothetical protein
VQKAGEAVPEIEPMEKANFQQTVINQSIHIMLIGEKARVEPHLMAAAKTMESIMNKLSRRAQPRIRNISVAPGACLRTQGRPDYLGASLKRPYQH